MQSNQFPSLSQAAFLLLANFLLQYFIGLAIHDLQGWLDLSPYQQGALAAVIANGIFLAVVTHFQDRTYGDLLHSAHSSKLATFLFVAPSVLLLVPFLLLLNIGLFEVLTKIWPLSRWEEEFFEMMREGGLTAVIHAILLAPVLEELVFRGILLRAFLSRYPRWPAIACSALFFGFAHLNIYQFALAFPLGLLLGWLFERSSSLIPCITLHAAFNAATVVLNASTQPEYEPSVTDYPPEVWLASIAALVLGASLLRWLFKSRPAPESPNAESGSRV